MKKISILLSLVAVLNVAHAGWLDALGLSSGTSNSTPSVNLSSLSDDQVVGGLKDALGNGLQQATSKCGVTSAYKNMMAKVNSSNNSLTGNLGGYANKYLGSDAVDLDGYVTSKALDGLFIMVADEEKRIRQDPAARTTDLMKQVFGAVQK